MKREYFEREDSRGFFGYGPRTGDVTAVTYTAVDMGRDSEDERGRRPYAQVEMQMPRESPRPLRDMATTGELLKSTPGAVTGAYAHDTMGGAITTLLGMATNRLRDATADSKTIPGHSHSLSTNSSAMVQNIRAKGVDIPVNSKNPGADPNNTIAEEGRSQYTIAPSELPGTEPIGYADRPQVRAGARTARDIMRGPRTPPINPNQFTGEQLRLF
jgi:hypothetical protein